MPDLLDRSQSAATRDRLEWNSYEPRSARGSEFLFAAARGVDGSQICTEETRVSVDNVKRSWVWRGLVGFPLRRSPLEIRCKYLNCPYPDRVNTHDCRIFCRSNPPRDRRAEHFFGQVLNFPLSKTSPLSIHPAPLVSEREITWVDARVAKGGRL